VTEEMSPLLKQPIVVESKPGASGGSIAADHVANSKADGDTIFFGTNSTHAANQSLHGACHAAAPGSAADSRMSLPRPSYRENRSRRSSAAATSR